MDFNIEVRRKQIENLSQLVSSSRNRIQSVLDFLDWKSENVKKEDPLVQCPINPHHRILPKVWNEHIQTCILKTEGYSLDEQFLSEPPADSKSSIYLDHGKKFEIITKELAEKGPLRLAWNRMDPDPKTSDRLQSTYSSDERLSFYNYCIANTEGPPEPPEFTTAYFKKSDADKPLSYEELLAQERDAKRRRAKYKSVHINKKNHTEVIREVINSQMEDYTEWLLNKNNPKPSEPPAIGNSVTKEDDKKEEQERPHSSISKSSNHSRSSSSRSTNRKYDRTRDRKIGRERSRERERSYKPRNSRRSRSNERSYKPSRSPDRNNKSKSREHRTTRSHSVADRRTKRDESKRH